MPTTSYSRNFELYAPLEKIEELSDGTVEVSGVVSSESRDADGERITAESMRKHIPSYMDYGAIREMHRSDNAAGTCLSIEVSDDGVTRARAHVVDPTSVKKVLAKVYKGFSIGGKKRKSAKGGNWMDVSRLTEISLVDRPNNPDANFTRVLAKVDTRGRVHLVDEAGLEKIAVRDDTSPAEGEEKYGKNAKFADPKNKKYPLDTKAHVRAALSYWGQSKNRAEYSSADQATIGARIRAAASRLGIGDEETQKLAKSMYDVQAMAGLLASLSNLCYSADFNADSRKDGSTVAQQLHDAAEQLCSTFRDLVDDETRVLLGLDDDDDADALLDKAMRAIEANGVEAPLRKVGKRFSKATADTISAIHDHVKAASQSLDDLDYRNADADDDTADADDDDDDDEDEDDTDGLPPAHTPREAEDMTKAEQDALDARLNKFESVLAKAEGVIDSQQQELAKAHAAKTDAETERDEAQELLARAGVILQKFRDRELAKGVTRRVPVSTAAIPKKEDAGAKPNPADAVLDTPLAKKQDPDRARKEIMAALRRPMSPITGARRTA